MDFKYFLKLSKVSNENGKTYLHGIASGTEIDRDGEKMSPKVIDEFVKAIKNKGLPLTNSHPRAGDVLGDMGKVVDGSILEDGKYSMLIKAEADMENPAMQYVLGQYSKGKKYGFSIEGSLGSDGVVATWDDKAKKVVREYVAVEPKAISLTTEPSYMGSFMDVVSKAFKTNNYNDGIDKIKDNSMETKEEIKEGVVETQPETVAEEVVAVEAEVKADEVKPEAEVAPVEPVVEEVVDKSVDENKDIVAKSEEVEAIEEIQEAIEEKKEEVIEAEESEKLEELCMKVDALYAIVEKLVSTDEMVHETFKSYQEKTTEVLKTFSDSVEVLSKVQVGRKAMVKATAIAEMESDKPQTFRDVVNNIL